MKTVIMLSLLSLLVLAACIPSQPTQIHVIEKVIPLGEGSYSSFSLDTTAELESFSSVEQFQAFSKRYENSYGNYYRGGGIAVDFLEADIALAPTLAKSESADGSVDFSETNNQVAGVDEADIIKTDGEYIYTITDGTLFVISAGEDAKVLDSISVGGYATGLFIQDDVLIVFGNNNDYDFYEELSFAPQNQFTYVKQYSIADKENVVLTDELFLEGNYYTARLHDDQLYVILQSYPDYRPIYPMPIIYDGEVKEMQPTDIRYFPYPYRSVELVTVHKLAIDDLSVSESVATSVDSLQSIYVSEENVYVVGYEYISEYDIERELTRELLEDELSSFDKQLIEEIKQVSDVVLSQSEKDQKIQQVYQNRIRAMSREDQDAFYDSVEVALKKELASYTYFEYTRLFKIPTDSLEIEATAKVPGQISNQFSLDEFDGYLRVATTISSRWSRFVDQTESSSNVFILDEDFDVVGELTGIAPTERIFSTRFVEDRLYMVTFRQVDPFFVIDLSKPTRPTILGELKIPGFSRYLHPYDENYIIGLGQDASETGRTTGLKISLFDVTDVENPIEVASYVGDDRYAGSTALYEHKAFLFSKDKNLLVIPAYNYDYQDRSNSYSGAFVFSISEDDVELRGLIDHGSDTEWYYGSQVERSLYIEDLLYTKSRELLRVNNLDDLESVSNVTLKTKSNLDIPIY